MGSRRRGCALEADDRRRVAQFGRATVSKTVGCGFNSCLACLSSKTPPRMGGVLKCWHEHSFDRFLRIVEVSVAKSKGKKVNPIVAYFRSTRAELKKVRWPTLREGWTMTKIVLLVTFAMAIFLGTLDFLFGWLLGQIIAGKVVFMVLGVLLAAGLIAAVYFVGRAEEV